MESRRAHSAGVTEKLEGRILGVTDLRNDGGSCIAADKRNCGVATELQNYGTKEIRRQ